MQIDYVLIDEFLIVNAQESRLNGVIKAYETFYWVDEA